MEFFDPKRLNFDFVKLFRPVGIVTGTLMVLSLLGVLYPGFNYGIDFRGGIEATVNFADKNVTQADLREVLDSKLKNLSIVNFSSDTKNEFSITAQSDDKASVSNILKTSLNAKYGNEGTAWTATKLDVVGPKVGSELRRSALLALIYTCLLVTIYMYWRFDIRYSPGALAAIFHDLALTSGFLILTRGEFDTTVLAALLTLAGYSINDTVVIYDRIREIEGRPGGKTRDRKAIINEAINSTLSRTIMTASTTLVCCLVLFFLGGPTLRWFAASLFFGIIVGTYSSVFVSAPFYMWTDAYFTRKEAEAKLA